MRHPLPRLHLALSLLAGLGFLVAPVARAEDAPAPEKKETQFFEALDTNRDGKVTLDEFRAAGKDEAAFPLFDKNKDGAVTPDELGLPADYKPAPRAKKEPAPGGSGGPGGPGGPGGAGGELRRRMKEMDADGDGKITREEWKGEAAGFERFDRNKDGVLDGQDLGGGRGMGGGPGAGMGGGMGGGGMLDPAQITQRWLKMDKDGDGKVSREEYTGEFDFERLDADKDGALTETDAKALVEAMRGQGGGQGGGGKGGPGGPGAGGPGGAGGQGGMQPSPEQIAKRFGELDKDKSGSIEAAEMPEPARERMLKADKDGNGALSQDEFLVHSKEMRRGPGGPGGPGGGPGGPGGPGAGPGPGPEMLKRFDHDRDGKVTRDQFPGGDEQFARLDKNGDGVLTAEDFPAPAGQGAPAPGTGAAVSLPALDKDGDGRLCRPEFPGSDADWRALDKNSDGWVTADELAK